MGYRGSLVSMPVVYFGRLVGTRICRTASVRYGTPVVPNIRTEGGTLHATINKKEKKLKKLVASTAANKLYN